MDNLEDINICLVLITLATHILYYNFLFPASLQEFLIVQITITFNPQLNNVGFHASIKYKITKCNCE